MRSAIAGLLLASSFLVGAGKAEACSCYTAEARERISQADLIFEGRAVSTEAALSRVDRLSRWLAPDWQTRIDITTFEAARIHKGPVRSHLEIRHYREEMECGYQFEPGQNYLVLAFQTGAGVYMTGLCELTGDIAAISTLLEAAG